jgi:transposase
MKRIAIISNSCNIDITKRLKKILLQYKWRLFILPPLSPQLNPIDMFFKEIKHQLRKKTDIFNLNQL